MNIENIVFKLPEDKKLPKYILFGDALKKWINENDTAVGMRLPSERALAENCNISTVTVSRGLNELVKKGILIRKHGSGTYIADKTVLGNNFRIGLVAHEPIINDDCYISTVLKTLYEYWGKRQVDIISFVKSPNEYEYIMSAYSLSGLIVLSPQERFLDEYKDLSARGVFFVTIGVLFKELPYNSFGTEHEFACRQAVEYLHSLGHEKIGLLNSQPEYSAHREREKGYLQGMWQEKLLMNPDWIVHGSFSGENNDRQKLEELLLSDNAPTALLISSYVDILWLYDFLKGIGIKIPDDLSLITFDDPVYAKQLHPAMTVFKQPIRDFTVNASMQLERMTRGEQLIPNEIMKSELIKRNSCRKRR